MTWLGTHQSAETSYGWHDGKEVCSAAITAGINLLPAASDNDRRDRKELTAFCTTWGSCSFRLDRWEPELNEAIPNDERDTTMPQQCSNVAQTINWRTSPLASGNNYGLDGGG